MTGFRAPASRATRIVVFAPELSHSVCKAIVEINRRINGAEWLIVGAAPRRADRSTVGQPDMPGAEYSVDRVLARPEVSYFNAATASAATVERVKEFAADVGLSLAAPLIAPGLADVPRLGTINLHMGKLPEYGGLSPVFWALWNDEEEVFCTAHFVSAGGKNGDVIGEAGVVRPRYATVRSMELVLGEIGIKLLGDAVEEMLADNIRPRQQGSVGRSYPNPTSSQIDVLRRRLASALPDRSSPYRRAARSVYDFLRLQLGRLARRFNTGPIVTVLAYHRVNDDLRDNVTVGIEQFDQQMAVLREHCCLVTIEEVVSGILPVKDPRPLVCVTFDDGYKDNFTNALPILMKHQVPAAFFVSTGFIGTTRRFPHDVQKGLFDLENMQWDDLREMRECGFVIGSHTVNHIDCGTAAGDVLHLELHQSLKALQTELGVGKAIFAYPFGRKENMSPEALHRIKQVGYLGCLSAYGGVNRRRVDPFDVRRFGVNWPYSNLGFRSRICG